MNTRDVLLLSASTLIAMEVAWRSEFDGWSLIVPPVVGSIAFGFFEGQGTKPKLLERTLKSYCFYIAVGLPSAVVAWIPLHMSAEITTRIGVLL